MTSAREQVLSGLKWTAGGKFGAQLITWAITLIVMRLLAPEDYGLLAMATVFVAFMSLLSEAGLGPALIQKSNLDDASVRSVFAIVIIANIGLLLLLNLLAPFIASFFDEERLILILRVLSLGFLLKIFSTLPSVQLYRQLRFKSLSLINFTTTIVGSVVTLLLAFIRPDVWALILGNLFASVLSAIAMNIVAPFYLRPRFSLTGMRDLLSFGKSITLARLLWFSFNQADAVIVGKLLGKEILGFYSVAMQLASLPVQRISSVINQVAFPVFSRIQDDSEQFRSFVLKASRLLSLAAFPVLWGISSVADEIVMLFLGQKWESAILPLQLLALMMPFRMLSNFFPSATDAAGHPEVALVNTYYAVCVIPAALLIGAVYWGLIGVVMAWVLTSPTLAIYAIHRSLRIMNLSLRHFFRSAMPAMSSAASMYLLVWITSSLLADSVDLWVKLMLMITTGALSYVGFSFLLNKQGCQEAIDLVRRRS